MMNPETNKLEPLTEISEQPKTKKPDYLKEGKPNPKYINKLFRPDGTPVPKHWSIFTIGENVVVKNYTFKIAGIGESSLLLEPVKSVIVETKGT